MRFPQKMIANAAVTPISTQRFCQSACIRAMRAAGIHAQPYEGVRGMKHLQPIQNTTSQLPRITAQGATEQLDSELRMGSSL
jgi:hypothetical protein